MRPIALANIGVQLLQEAVFSVLESASGDSVSTSDIESPRVWWRL